MFQCFDTHTKSQSSLLILLGNIYVHVMEKKRKKKQKPEYKISPQWCKTNNNLGTGHL